MGGCGTGTSAEWDQPHSPACAPSWGFSQALIFPSLCWNPGQGCQRRREEPSLLGRKRLLGLAWECGGPRRLLSPGLTLRSGPCTLPYLPQQDQGLCPGWLQPWFPSAALRRCWPGGLCPPSWAQGHVCPTLQPQLRWHRPGCASDWDRTAVWWVLTTQTQGLPLPFLVFLAVSLDLHPGAAAG